MDTEWLLSTLFDASLLSTFKAAGLRRLFFVLRLFPVEFQRMTRGNHIRACHWTPRSARAMICSS
ncbi:protein of unknown function [Bradyrhizobium vignae]|uniref:Uncharacterized protein n=1 Tax=Bradyrhizobium vignae TaxID=1549949 RepID=A0A2U3QBC0_9BRAD|nr:protein of unknown function [Bradyrhizobium vignae]